jgi:beta-lactamase superfamily II metal-dependent hydrolase
MNAIRWLARLTAGIGLAMGLLAAPAVIAMAQEPVAIYLALNGEGSASAILDEIGQTAYITDGGKLGTEGIALARIEGQEILSYLSGKNVKTLVITCTHADFDHAGGLLEMVRSPLMGNFEEVLFVDPGLSGSGRSVYEAFMAQPLAGRVKANYTSARTGQTIQDVMSGLPLRKGAVSPANLNYRIQGTEVHDRALVLSYHLQGNAGSQTIVDFDDASDRVLRQWVASGASLDIAIFPHHGSGGSDASLVLGRGVKSVIFTADEANRFRHPAPKNFLAAIRAVGVRNVYITGSRTGSNLEVSPGGILSFDDTRRRSMFKSYFDFQNARLTPEITSAGTQEARRQRALASMSHLAAAETEVNRVLGGQPTAGPVTRAARSSTGARFYGRLAETFRSTYGNELPVSRSPRGTVRQLARGLELRGIPTWGGILLSGPVRNDTVRVHAAGIVPLGAGAGQQSEGAFVWIETGSGEVYHSEVLSSSVMWSAYQLLNPDSYLIEEFEYLRDATNIGLVGKVDESLDGCKWTFGIHPGIAGTPVATAAMKLDMLPYAIQILQRDMGTALPASYARIRSGLSLTQPYQTYQWYDGESTVALRGDSLLVRATEASYVNTSTLLRFRLYPPVSTLVNREVAGLRAVRDVSDAAVTINDVARALAILAWLDNKAVLPGIPDTMGGQPSSGGASLSVWNVFNEPALKTRVQQSCVSN